MSGSWVVDPGRTRPGERRVVGSPAQRRRLGDRRDACPERGGGRWLVEEHEGPDGHAQGRVLPDPPHDRFDGAQTVIHPAHRPTMERRHSIMPSVGRGEPGRHHPLRVKPFRGLDPLSFSDRSGWPGPPDRSENGGGPRTLGDRTSSLRLGRGLDALAREQALLVEHVEQAERRQDDARRRARTRRAPR